MSLRTLGGYTTFHITARVCTLCVFPNPLVLSLFQLKSFLGSAAPSKNTILSKGGLIESFRLENIFKIVESNPKITCRKL